MFVKTLLKKFGSESRTAQAAEFCVRYCDRQLRIPDRFPFSMLKANLENCKTLVVLPRKVVLINIKELARNSNGKRSGIKPNHNFHSRKERKEPARVFLWPRRTEFVNAYCKTMHKYKSAIESVGSVTNQSERETYLLLIKMQIASFSYRAINIKVF